MVCSGEGRGHGDLRGGQGPRGQRQVGRPEASAAALHDFGHQRVRGEPQEPRRQELPPRGAHSEGRRVQDPSQCDGALRDVRGSVEGPNERRLPRGVGGAHRRGGLGEGAQIRGRQAGAARQARGRGPRAAHLRGCPAPCRRSLAEGDEGRVGLQVDGPRGIQPEADGRLRGRPHACGLGAALATRCIRLRHPHAVPDDECEQRGCARGGCRRSRGVLGEQLSGSRTLSIGGTWWCSARIAHVPIEAHRRVHTRWRHPHLQVGLQRRRSRGFRRRGALRLDHGRGLP
mmetsp:Transcript_63595/g.179511  ORF Transcript_63595/g.179511 Transcript_63595/m.179511 type:complete len:287 (-) Transcript_63595:243-1103(-)